LAHEGSLEVVEFLARWLKWIIIDFWLRTLPRGVRPSFTRSPMFSLCKGAVATAGATVRTRGTLPAPLDLAAKIAAPAWPAKAGKRSDLFCGSAIGRLRLFVELRLGHGGARRSNS